MTKKTEYVDPDPLMRMVGEGRSFTRTFDAWNPSQSMTMFMGDRVVSTQPSLDAPYQREWDDFMYSLAQYSNLMEIHGTFHNPPTDLKKRIEDEYQRAQFKLNILFEKIREEE